MGGRPGHVRLHSRRGTSRTALPARGLVDDDESFPVRRAAAATLLPFGPGVMLGEHAQGVCSMHECMSAVCDRECFRERVAIKCPTQNLFPGPLMHSPLPPSRTHTPSYLGSKKFKNEMFFGGRNATTAKEELGFEFIS